MNFDFMLQFHSLTGVYCARSGLNILLVVHFYEFSKVYLSEMINIKCWPGLWCKEESMWCKREELKQLINFVFVKF